MPRGPCGWSGCFPEKKNLLLLPQSTSDSSVVQAIQAIAVGCRLRLKCDVTRAETRIRLSAKRTRPFKSAGALIQSTMGSRGSPNSGSNAGYTKFRGSVKGTGYPLHSPVSPSLPLPCVTLCHHVSTGLYRLAPVGMKYIEGLCLSSGMLSCQS